MHASGQLAGTRRSREEASVGGGRAAKRALGAAPLCAESRAGRRRGWRLGWSRAIALPDREETLAHLCKASGAWDFKA